MFRFFFKKTKVPNNKRAIFYFSPNLPDFDTSSGGKRAVKILEILIEKYNVFVFSKGTCEKRHVDYLQSKGITVLKSLRKVDLHQAKSKVDFIVFAWYNSYYQFKGVLKYFPEAKIIIDSVDIHWVREKRLLGTHPIFSIHRIEANKIKELAAYKIADVIFAVTNVDKEEILKELPEKKVEVISNIHVLEEPEYIENHSNKILFIGGFRHYPNIGAAKFLAKSIFPKVLEKIHDAELIIAGSNAPPEIIELGSLPAVKFLGYVPENELKSIYGSVCVSVSPLFAGSGIKGKICESISFRRPVITNNIGNEGIGLLHEKDALICSMDEMPGYIVKTLNREYDFQKMTESAWKKIEPIIGLENARKKVLSQF
jgi:O-antigen biosynthesis protein